MSKGSRRRPAQSKHWRDKWDRIFGKKEKPKPPPEPKK